MDFLWAHSHSFVKFHRRRVTAPDVEGYVITSRLSCKLQCRTIKLAPDMLPPYIFINTEIINIKRLYVGKNGIVFVPLKNAEAVSQNLVMLIDRNQYRSVFIFKKSFELLFVILSSDFEYVGPAFMVNKVNLRKQVQNLRNVFFFCVSYHSLNSFYKDCII